MSNKKFRIIPVLDIQGGKVVRGIKGERSNYQPIRSKLIKSNAFSDVLQFFYRQFGFTEFYIADIDALITKGKKRQLNLMPCRDDQSYPFSLMLDTGISDPDTVDDVLKTGVEKVILGTETLPSLDVLISIIEYYGPHRLVVSIDTKNGQVISSSPQIRDLSPSDVIRTIKKIGIQEFILLQLGRVGTKEGLKKEMIKECLAVLGTENNSQGNLLIGGGISGLEDLKWLAAHGAGGALIATILHDGHFRREEFDVFKF